MAEVASSSASATSKKTKKAPTSTTKKSAEKTRAHPPASEMVTEAILTLNDRKGSSLQAIKKYIAENFKCDVDKQATFIRKFIRSAVEKNTLVQTKGIGASGSFKLAKPEKTVKKSKVTDEKKPAEKPEKLKKTASAKPKVTKTAKKTNSPVKKTGKSPTSKPKAPKTKKATSKPAKK